MDNEKLRELAAKRDIQGLHDALNGVTEDDKLRSLVKERNIDGLRSMFANIGRNAVSGAVNSDGWDEGKHPRGEGGRFTSGGGMSGSTKRDIQNRVKDIAAVSPTSELANFTTADVQDVIDTWKDEGSTGFAFKVGDKVQSYPLDHDGFGKMVFDLSNALEENKEFGESKQEIRWGSVGENGEYEDYEKFDIEYDDDDDNAPYPEQNQNPDTIY